MYLAEKEINGKLVRLRVEHDDITLNNPREWDNLGTMVCWHNRYDLGDSHDYGEPRDFLVDLIENLNSTTRYEELEKYVENYFKNHCVKKDDKGDYYIAYGDEFIEEYYDTEDEAYDRLDELKDEFIDYDWQDELKNNELMSIIENHYVILPLFLYDHSGITMNTTGFTCGWDSGQVGWIYVSHDVIKEEYGKDDEEQLEEVRTYLENEVETYDQYLRGEVYYFSLEEKVVCECCKNEEWEHIDSCGGFYGSDWEENGLKDHVGKEYEELVNELKYQFN